MALGLGSSVSFTSGLTEGCKYFKGVYDTNQTSQSGIKADNIFSGVTAATGDTWTITGNIYLTGSGNTFDAGVDAITTKISMGSQQVSLDINQNTLVAFDETAPAMSSGWSDNMFIYWTSSYDYPDNGATFYISDFKIVVKDNGGSVKATKVYDFSSSGDISMWGDWSVEGEITKTKGSCLP